MLEHEEADPARRVVVFWICILVALMSALIFGALMLFAK